MTTPRRKACVECRQQKIRCDVEQHKTPHEPCTRCKKMSLECRILPTSTRNLRQTKAEMRRELEELRWNMRQNQANPGHPNDPNHPLSTPTSNVDMQGFSPMEGSGTYSNPSARTEASNSLSPGFVEEISRPPMSNGSKSVNTIPRALDGHIVDAKRIDDCFTLFFNQYHPLLPILDPSVGPNEYYDLSPFLFWTIVTTGSRRYHEDPTILEKTSQLITPLAFSSMALRSTPIPVIQGLLILCTWRLPTNSMYKDMTHVLCGAAVHLSTQIGLHIAGVGQDFARMPLKKDQDQKIFRAKLWMHCVIVSIRTSCAEGIPPLAETFFENDERDREDMIPFLPNDVVFLHKVYLILLRAMAAMGRTDSKSINCDIRVLRSLISIFDSQLVSLMTSSPSEHHTFQLNCARIHILAFHFFAHPTNPGPDADALSRLFSLCISTIKTAHTMAEQTNFATMSQSFIDRTMTLAGFAILKLCRSPLAQYLDLGSGEQAFLYAAQYIKDTSLLTGDLGTRVPTIMTNLWNSSKIFRGKDERVESLGLRLRTRLSMSVSFDMFWYWREEFGHMANPYNGEENAVPSNAQTQPGTPGTSHVQAPVANFNPAANINASANAFDQPQAAVTGFGTWDGTSYNIPPTMDQFPDYDWAAGFNFSSADWPAVPMAPIIPEGTGYTFG